MQLHNSNLRPSVREHFTDYLSTTPVDTSVSMSSNPLLSASEQGHIDAIRNAGAMTFLPLDYAITTLADDGLIPFFNVTWAHFLSALVVAFNGGAYVGGNLIPMSYELVQGVHTGLPFLFNGLGLAVCGAVAHSLHDTPRNIGFAVAQTVMTAWI